jgi:hypothetical protein
LTDRTGWTPQQILQLTLGQLSVYLNFWIGSKKKGTDDNTFDDLELFNIMAGIPKKVVKKS